MSFISGHPWISKLNPKQLLALSTLEQTRYVTLEWVVERLEWLNGVYEGRYVMFVNGRTRKEVMEEMECVGGGEGM